MLGLLEDGIRWLLMSLDQLVYGLIAVIYNIFEAVTNVRLFWDSNGGGLIEEVANRIYALIGVYALFKVTFILINMLINPDNFNDKQKGAGKLIVRIVGMLALIIAVPWIFGQAYELQNIVLNENVIGTILLGNYDDGSTSDSADKIKKDKVGNYIANEIFSGFVSIDEGAKEKSSGDNSDLNSITLSSEASSACSDSLNALKTVEKDGISVVKKHINDEYKSSDGEEYCINYQFFISTLAGGFAAYVFAVYCLDIGLRVAKLAFYELVAPVPIATFVDGKKDGPFNNWVKSVISTYVDLFIRLLIIYFIILVVREAIPDIMDMPALAKYDFVTRNFAKIIIILGLLMFATQAPKLIKDLFGVKGDGADYGLSMKNKIGASPIAAGALGLAGGAIAGGAANAIAGASNVKAAWKQAGTDGKGKGGQLVAAIGAGAKGTLSTVAGMTSAGKVGLMTGSKMNQKDFNMGKILATSSKTSVDNRNARAKRKEDLNDRLISKGENPTIKNRMGMRMSDAFDTAGYNVSQRFAGINPKESKVRASNISRYTEQAQQYSAVAQDMAKKNPNVIASYNDGIKVKDTYTDSTGKTVELTYYYDDHVNPNETNAYTQAEQSEYTNILKQKAFAEAKAKHEQAITDKQTPKKEAAK
ncbi:MAG: hypothetical protein IJO57_01230 [Bacilli bacterium]|nr:hypothetical protein [Bacilli bacterium]